MNRRRFLTGLSTAGGQASLKTLPDEPDFALASFLLSVLGEGGIHAPSQAFWDRLGALCKRCGWLLCLGEVQTCMGRCGEMFAMQRWQNIDPDLILLGKAFAAGGQPIAAILGTDAVMDNTDLHLGSTYGFAPAACAGALTDTNPALTARTNAVTNHWIRLRCMSTHSIVGDMAR